MHRCAFQVGQARLLSIECCQALCVAIARMVPRIALLLVIACWGLSGAQAWQGPSMAFNGAGGLPGDGQLAARCASAAATSGPAECQRLHESAALGRRAAGSNAAVQRFCAASRRRAAADPSAPADLCRASPGRGRNRTSGRRHGPGPACPARRGHARGNAGPDDSARRSEAARFLRAGVRSRGRSRRRDALGHSFRLLQLLLGSQPLVAWRGHRRRRDPGQYVDRSACCQLVSRRRSQRNDGSHSQRYRLARQWRHNAADLARDELRLHAARGIFSHGGT